MVILLVILHVIVCLFLIGVVLLQQGKSANLAGAFGGQGSQTAFGPRGAANLLTKLTTLVGNPIHAHIDRAHNCHVESDQQPLSFCLARPLVSRRPRRNNRVVFRKRRPRACACLFGASLIRRNFPCRHSRLQLLDSRRRRNARCNCD